VKLAVGVVVRLWRRRWWWSQIAGEAGEGTRWWNLAMMTVMKQWMMMALMKHVN